MSDRLLIDVDAAGRMSVSTWPDDGSPEAIGAPVELAWSLSSEELDDLRWYLEDYLKAPFAVYEDRGYAVAARLSEWGRSLFTAVFGAGPIRDAYVRLRQRAVTPGAAEIVVRSAAARWLELPWELLHDPSRDAPIALDGVSLGRTLPSAHLAEVFPVGGRKLRVLMVICRPHGDNDVGYQMIARPLLTRLAAVRGQVDLRVLRPPTLAALEARLREANEAGEPFQIVHFDGHGAFAGHGVLVFERLRGGADHVPVDRIAQVLAAAKVPVAVLNACQSGAVGKQVEAAVATRLLAGGASAVVAMAYRVYAVAAAEFMTIFYERLFAGDSVAEAVRAGRAGMALRSARPTPKGELPLADWLVPVHYLRREVRFPHLHAATTTQDGAVPGTDGSVDDLTPVGEFVGRDGLFHTLEVAARTDHVVLLHGTTGTGKTELAKAFGRWWRDTGGVEQPEWVIWHSFRPGVASFALDGVISAIGLRVYGVEFVRHDPDERRERVHRLLEQHQLLLIWDNFESVAAMSEHTGGTPPLDDAGRVELRDFLARVARAGRSTVLITSRTTETWLGDRRRVRVSGLTRDDAIAYADTLLAPFPAAAARREDRAFEELLAWLDGHPLSMRVVLPLLANTDAATLLAGLHGQLPLPGTGESATLAAGLNYSLTHLPPADRVALVVLALFEGAVPATALILFSRDEGVPERFRGLESQWVWALERAAEVGLLTRLGKAMYAIHPALPAHLAELWRAEDPAAYQQQRANSEPALLSAYASFGSWLQGQIQEGSGASALHYMDLHRHMLGRMFGYALATRQWEQAEFIARPLNHYWNRNELVAESRYWVDRGRTALEAETGGPPPVDHPGGVLWLFLVGTQARRLVVTGQLDAAATTYTDMVTALRTQPESRQQRQQLAICYQELGTVANNQGRLGDAEQWCRRALGIMTELDDRVRTPAICADLGSIARSQGRLDEADEWIRQAFGFWEQSRDQMSMANGYHELGIIAQLRSRFDEAAQWYHKALDIKSELGDRYGMISAYHQLGMVAELCGRLAEADLWYRQALGLEEELRNRPRIAQTCHHLGRLAQERERFDEAEQWYRHSLAISEELDDKPGMTTSYGQLGILAQSRDRLDEAEQWYRRSHAVSEEFGSRAGMAKAHHQLGILAQLRGQFDEAEREYHKALAIEKELDDRPGMALTYAGLGLLTEQRGELELAMRWAVRSVSLFDEFPHPAAKAGTRHLLQLVDRFGVPALERCWATVTGAPLPTDIRTLLLAWLELPDTAGHDASG